MARGNPATTENVPGAQAERPGEIPKKGWWQILRRAWKEGKKDNVPLLAAGSAFYAFLALFPALIAAVMVYGLVADPADVEKQVKDIGEALPSDAQSLLTDQMSQIASGKPSALGIGLIIALALAIWSAAGGISGLITAINIAYDEEETRGFVKMRALAMALTFGAVLLFAIVIGLVAVLPAVFDSIGAGTIGRVVAELVRWPLLFVVVIGALAFLYKVAPNRNAPKMRWATPGSVIATVLWLIATIGFSLYVDNFGSYGKTYGALAGVVVMLLWLWISVYIVLLGAEINAEAEQQTVRDTTVGPPEPIGQRGAVKADSTPPGDPPEEKHGKGKHGAEQPDRVNR